MRNDGDEAMSNPFIYCPYCKEELDIYNELHTEDIGFIQIVHGVCPKCDKQVIVTSQNIYGDAPKG